MKKARHFVIREILSNSRVTTQDSLCQELKNRGFDVTQATISRDIKEMQLIKIPDDDGYKYGLPSSTSSSVSERMKRIFSDAVLDIKHNDSLIVIKTLPGSAQAVGSLIDASSEKDIIGTVAGDDTIFVALQNRKAMKRILNKFHSLIAG